MGTKWSPKDPDAVLDYLVDWDKNWLPADDYITSTEWVAISDEITIESFTIVEEGRKVLVWISGGIAGTTYELTNRVHTFLNRTQDQTIKLKCKER